MRFVQVFNGAYAMGEGVGNWDGHRQLKADYDRHGPVIDRPTAALLKDLKRSGLLDDTLLLWSTEFGRMPTFHQAAQGRDHNPKGFTAWMAGAGVKSRSATARPTSSATRPPRTSPPSTTSTPPSCASSASTTKAHLYHNGPERRLTDVHGEVLNDVLAT